MFLRLFLRFSFGFQKLVMLYSETDLGKVLLGVHCMFCVSGLCLFAKLLLITATRSSTNASSFSSYDTADLTLVF